MGVFPMAEGISAGSTEASLFMGSRGISKGLLCPAQNRLSDLPPRIHMASSCSSITGWNEGGQYEEIGYVLVLYTVTCHLPTVVVWRTLAVGQNLSHRLGRIFPAESTLCTSTYRLVVKLCCQQNEMLLSQTP